MILMGYTTLRVCMYRYLYNMYYIVYIYIANMISRYVWVFYGHILILMDYG